MRFISTQVSVFSRDVGQKIVPTSAALLFAHLHRCISKPAGRLNLIARQANIAQKVIIQTHEVAIVLPIAKAAQNPALGRFGGADRQKCGKKCGYSHDETFLESIFVMQMRIASLPLIRIAQSVRLEK